MAGIFGALGLDDTDRVYQATQGQAVIYEAIQAYIDRVNQDIAAAISIFVDSTTEDHVERWFAPGNGELADLGQNPQTIAPAMKASGSWDVAYPLNEWGGTISSSRVSMAYMTVGQLERHVLNITAADVKLVRGQLLTALLDNTTFVFPDDNWGNLTVQPLANDDTVLYPEVIGASAEATEDHYLESGYLAAAITDANNPYVTIEADLVHHFGKSQGGDDVVVFINSAQKDLTMDLTDFTELTDLRVIPGTQTARLTGLPVTHPGRVVGRTNGCWVVEWDYVPANYMIGVLLSEDPPLKMRTDPADTGLGSGLQLVTEDEVYPFKTSHWSHRFGVGVGNRLNGVIMELGTGGTYTVPTGFSR